MTLQAYFAALDKLAALRPAYRLGGKGVDGTCDCIGMVMYAVEQCGIRWPGIHGSNWAARNVTANLRQVAGASALTVGDIIYKAREPGDRDYALPGRYDGHPDRRDYYHVGVVRSVSPMRIQHCTSGGIRQDNKLGSWRYAGRLNLLEEAGNGAPDADKADNPASRSTLRRGSRGDAVVTLQLALRDRGFDLEPDGIFGAITAECVKSFQAAHGLSADGIVGPLTWAALDEKAPSGGSCTVTIPGLSREAAEALAGLYPGAEILA